MKFEIFYGWRVVAACFVIACFSWGLGLFGSSVYLQAVTAARGWSISEVSSAITTFLLISAAGQSALGRSIARHDALLLGTVCMCIGVACIGVVGRPWQLYPCFALLGIGWATLSTTGISATVAPWFERHQGRSITLAIMGASFGAILGVPALLYTVDRLGLREGLLAASAVAVLVLLPLIGVVLRYRGPEDLGIARDGGLLGAGGAPEFTKHIATPENRRRLLWSATVAFALTLLAQIGFIAHHVALAAQFLGNFGAGVLVSATGAVTLFGRLYLAKIVDSAPVRRLACQAMVAQLAALLAIGLFPSIPTVIVGSLIYGFAIGHVTTLSPIVIRREFGAKAFAEVYGTAATFIQFSSACGPAFIGYLHERLGGYPPVLLISSAVTALGCASLYFGAVRDR
ncbi:MFS transporter [Bradyrhizobium acaciae]|uniref:MFS transporter n=1 Tax=Bradyrhizobium acaciae TaxID=2683706 RepID=UPI001E4F7A33|nr:MFS transporter [Bradyrhizobium acaciae]MCC8977343.1 MFS transporter [Bradyrhizobium acaciae]